jgi:TPR repeat protein
MELLAQTGDAQALATMGNLYLHAIDRPQNLELARHYLGQAALQHHAVASYQYALMCANGLGGAVDIAQAFRSLKVSAQASCEQGLLTYTAMLLKHHDDIDADLIDDARHLIQHSLDRAASPIASYCLAHTLMLGPNANWPRARQLLESGMQQGHVASSLAWAMLAIDGKGGASDASTARSVLSHLTHHHRYVPAIWRYVRVCLSGIGGAPDARGAIAQLEYLAAEHDDVGAMMQLAQLYQAKWPFRNHDKALHHLQRAIECSERQQQLSCSSAIEAISRSSDLSTVMRHLSTTTSDRELEYGRALLADMKSNLAMLMASVPKHGPSSTQQRQSYMCTGDLLHQASDCGDARAQLLFAQQLFVLSLGQQTQQAESNDNTLAWVQYLQQSASQHFIPAVYRVGTHLMQSTLCDDDAIVHKKISAGKHFAQAIRLHKQLQTASQDSTCTATTPSQPPPPPPSSSSTQPSTSFDSLISACHLRLACLIHEGVVEHAQQSDQPTNVVLPTTKCWSGEQCSSAEILAKRRAVFQHAHSAYQLQPRAAAQCYYLAMAAMQLPHELGADSIELHACHQRQCGADNDPIITLLQSASSQHCYAAQYMLGLWLASTGRLDDARLVIRHIAPRVKQASAILCDAALFDDDQQLASVLSRQCRIVVPEPLPAASEHLCADDWYWSTAAYDIEANQLAVLPLPSAHAQTLLERTGKSLAEIRSDHAFSDAMLLLRSPLDSCRSDALRILHALADSNTPHVDALAALAMHYHGCERYRAYLEQAIEHGSLEAMLLDADPSATTRRNNHTELCSSAPQQAVCDAYRVAAITHDGFVRSFLVQQHDILLLSARMAHHTPMAHYRQAVAYQLLTLAANDKNVLAQLMLAHVLGVVAPPAASTRQQAQQWLKTATAQHGGVDTQLAWARHHLANNDVDQAHALLRQLVLVHQHAAASLLLGVQLADSTTPQDRAEAARLLVPISRTACKLISDNVSMRDINVEMVLASTLRKLGHYEAAQAVVVEAVDCFNTTACFERAMALFTDDANSTEAHRLLQAAAQRGDAAAQALLGLQLLQQMQQQQQQQQQQQPASVSNQTTEFSSQRERTIVNLAALSVVQNESAFGCFLLAVLYRIGACGVQCNGNEARRLAMIAANAGIAEAQVLLADLLWNGIGGEKLPHQAVSWLSRAAENGSHQAQQMLTDRSGQYRSTKSLQFVGRDIDAVLTRSE